MDRGSTPLTSTILMTDILQWLNSPTKIVLVTTWVITGLIAMGINLFYCVLGGYARDLWKPFAVGLLGPIGLVLTALAFVI